MLFMIPFYLDAQDCTLNVGSEKTSTFISVFQLNEAQIEKMETWRAELSIEVKLIEDKMSQLLSTHPQSTPQELTDLAAKYKGQKEKLIAANIRVDKKLIAIFNEKQYQRYAALCHEVVREPFEVTPVVLEASPKNPE